MKAGCSIMSLFIRNSFFFLVFTAVQAQVDDGEYADAVNEELELNQDIEEQEESSDQDEDAVLPNQRFVPREEISQDFGVSFPIDI